MSGVGAYGALYEETRRMILEDDARGLAERRKARSRRERRATWASVQSLINTYSRVPRRHGMRRR